MERLTYRKSDGSVSLNAVFQSENWMKIFERIAEYEDADEQGLLSRLPCKPGDAVWCLEECVDGFDCVECIFLSECNGYYITTAQSMITETVEGLLEELVDDCENWGHTDVYFFHKNRVFLTKAEAEKALAELQSK